MKYQLPFAEYSLPSFYRRLSVPPCPGFSLSLSLLLPESSAISEFDATGAIRYRPRKSDCSLWSRNNCAGLPVSGETGMVGNGFANRKRRNEDRARKWENRREKERERSGR